MFDYLTAAARGLVAVSEPDEAAAAVERTLASVTASYEEVVGRTNAPPALPEPSDLDAGQ